MSTDEQWAAFLSKIKGHMGAKHSDAVARTVMLIMSKSATLEYPKAALFEKKTQLLWELESGTMIVQVNKTGQVSWDFYAGDEGYLDPDDEKSIPAISRIVSNL